MKQIFIALFLIVITESQAQNYTENDSLKVQDKFYTECFENLSQGNEILQNYPFFEKTKVCSIMECLILLEAKESDLYDISMNRLIGIATQFFNRNTPVILVSGMDSSLSANEKNVNTKDDDGIVYVSVGECVISKALSEGQKAFNNQTIKLINKKRNGI